MSAWLASASALMKPSLLTLLTLGGAYAAGCIARRVVVGRLAAVARGTPGDWDDILIDEVGRRVPLWSLLAGLYIAAEFWTLPPRLSDATNQALFVALVLSLTFAATAVVGRLASEYGSTFRHAVPVTSLSRNVARAVIATVGLLIILNRLGLSITPILTALGVGGLAVALALQETLSNLFAGFYIIVAGQIPVGDQIGLQSGEHGRVADIGWRATRLDQLPNNAVLVPNAKLAQSIVTNYDLPTKELSVPIEVAVSYGSNLEAVERVTREVGQEVLRGLPGGVGAFDPIVRFHTFGDSGILLTVTLRAREYADQFAVRHEFVKRLSERYAREGITIPFPTRTIVRQSADA